MTEERKGTGNRVDGWEECQKKRLPSSQAFSHFPMRFSNLPSFHFPLPTGSSQDLFQFPPLLLDSTTATTERGVGDLYSFFFDRLSLRVGQIVGWERDFGA